MSTKVAEVMTGVVRPIAKFPKSVWGDHFLKYSSSSTHDSSEDEKINPIYYETKERVRANLKSTNSDIMSLLQKLNLIDVIQRLGVSYHFENEIDQLLQSLSSEDQYMHFNYEDNDLYSCALRFRLLRQQGYNLSSDVFKKFLDKEGGFKTSIKNDIMGMLSLHEATYFRSRGEDILEEAFNFTATHFKTMLLHDRDLLDRINPYLAQQVTHALDQSLIKGFVRIDARNYFKFYENCNIHDQKLLEFAKLDFNILQKMHQRELAELTRWWKDLDFHSKFPFSRDRLVECYFYALVIYFDPEYAFGRKTFTKAVALLTVLDDIYDAYGTWEELVLFTKIINRWERSDLNQLSEPFKYLNEAINDFVEGLENECAERKNPHCVQYFKRVVKDMANAYMKEARWLNEKHNILTLEEYMSVALVTGGGRLLTVIGLIGMDPSIATEEAFDWAFTDPSVINSVSVIIRLIDDISGFKFELERDHIASSVQVYMNQHGVSKDITLFDLRKHVIDAWKDINSELIQSTNVSKALLHLVTRIPKLLILFRGDVDGFTHPNSKAKDLANLLVNPINV